MKNIISLFIFSLLLIFQASCSKKQTLILLNWGQYINSECIKKFEEKFHAKVRICFADSNEIMYTQIKARTTAFDIAIPSDYMIHKLYKENLIYNLSEEKIPNAQYDLFDEELNKLRSKYFTNNEKVAVPYFWGSLAIMYRKNEDIKENVLNKEWGVFFDKDLQKKYRIGMYNSSRDAISSGLLYLGKSLNTKDFSVLKQVEKLLQEQNYFTWATDNLKQLVATDNLDIALVYSGDFFDMLYATLDEELDVDYDVYLPKINNVWYDAMVIPKTSKNLELAHKFINFMTDPEIAYLNATEVGYAPSLKRAYELLTEDEDYKEVVNNYPLRPNVDFTESEIYEDLGAKFYKKFEIILSNVKS